MPGHDQVLLQTIDTFLIGSLPFERFSREFYDSYIEVVPDDALTDSQREFYFPIQEKLDWTAPGEPDEESRRYGLDRA